MNYEIKNIKSFMGEDCPGYNATLYREGKKIAFLIDSGNGGMLDVQWADRDVKYVSVDWINSDGKPVTFKCHPEEKLIRDSIRGKTWDFEGQDMGQIDLDHHLACLVQDAENDARFKRMCKKETLFRLKTDPKGEYRRCPAVFSKRVKDLLLIKFGEIEVILNEKYGQVAA